MYTVFFAVNYCLTENREPLLTTPVKSSDLAYFAGQFIDINSQSDSGLLTDVNKQIELIGFFRSG